MTSLVTRPASGNDEELLALYSDPDTCPSDSLKPVALVEEKAGVSWQQDFPRE